MIFELGRKCSDQLLVVLVEDSFNVMHFCVGLECEFTNESLPSMQIMLLVAIQDYDKLWDRGELAFVEVEM